MRKSIKKFLESLTPSAAEVGITGVVEFDEKELKTPESIFLAEQLSKLVDDKVKDFSFFLCNKKYVPCPDNWKLIEPHWYNMDDNSGQRHSFEDIYKLYIIENESK